MVLGTATPGAPLDIVRADDPFIKVYDNGVMGGSLAGMRLIHHLDTWADQYFKLRGQYDGVNYKDYLTVRMETGDLIQPAAADTLCRVYRTLPITWTPANGVARKICEFNPAVGAGANNYIGVFYGVLFIKLVTVDTENYNPQVVLQRYILDVRKWYGAGYNLHHTSCLLDCGKLGNATITITWTNVGDSRVDLNIAFTATVGNLLNSRIASAWIEGVSTSTYANNLVIPTMQA